MSSDPEVVVIGAGPNGLAAACVLARAGLSVLVVEAHPERAGGALASDAGTLPGFTHDVGAAFFPFAQASPAFRDLRLDEHGLRWTFAPIESAHPAPDGSVAVLARDLDIVERNFGSPEDGARMRRVCEWHRKVEPSLIPAMLETFPAIRPALGLLPFAIIRIAATFMRSGARLSNAWFRSEAARRVIPGLALHTDVGPDDTFGSGIGYMLAVMATTGGYGVPEGGAGAITAALLGKLESHGGRLQLGARVESIVVRDNRAVAVVLADGQEIRASTGILSDTSAPALLGRLVDAKHLPGRIVRKMASFASGWGTFKIDWALDGPVPWSCEPAREAAVVHAGDSLEDLRRFTNEVRGGALPSNPYLVIGQQSLSDPTRAPAQQHTLWAYSRVPNHAPGAGDWAELKARFADTVDARIEALAPGFRDRVLARRAVSPDDLEHMDANLIGGDLGGGSNAWYRQLLFRPVFPWFRYRMPVRGLYLGSSYAHPGAGVHGMCGYNAAQMLLRDL
ncbi:phytoene desaturase family protein [Enhygromyxa salina]|uniref:Pyridine nucleotide-disulfide oxidoreductase domain-containing protein 2 n=1 Tax=Enhygromyxa salina TaxID=215803 RepID=A0A2S9YUP5_9BACT|nr:NAD(P)/FAD-dependent oxidoreductase [Enhygromyxa salina]PRQ08818.1 All-trans-zeta-carotene desaturase [Enhygromyxa salina]